MRNNTSDIQLLSTDEVTNTLPNDRNLLGRKYVNIYFKYLNLN